MSKKEAERKRVADALNVLLCTDLDYLQDSHRLSCMVQMEESREIERMEKWKVEMKTPMKDGTHAITYFDGTTNSIGTASHLMLVVAHMEMLKRAKEIDDWS